MHLQLKMVTIDHFALVYLKRHIYFLLASAQVDVSTLDGALVSRG